VITQHTCARVKVLHPTRHKIGHFGDIHSSLSLDLVVRNYSKHNNKQTRICNKIYYNTKQTGTAIAEKPHDALYQLKCCPTVV